MVTLGRAGRLQWRARAAAGTLVHEGARRRWPLLMVRCAAAVLVLAGLGAQAQSTPVASDGRAGPIEVTRVEGIAEYRLANGLQILLNPDASKPTTTVNVTYHVGSRYESYGETGMAHLLEHLMFKGSPKHPHVWAEFTKRGLSANGSTWYDRTNYFASFAANEDNLKWYLQWQADAMVNSYIARKDLDSEMTVVRNEMEMGENDPGRILMEKTISAMYQWHNYGKSTIGARADVEGVDITHLQAFYRRYYQPDNATLIVSGKFDAPEVLKWIQASFGAIPRPHRALPSFYTLDAAQDGERSVTLRRVGGVPLLYVGYHIVSGADPDYAAFALLSIILGDSPSGRLHHRLVDAHLATEAFAFTEALADPGFMLLGAQLGADQDRGAAAAGLQDEAEAFASRPITQQELDRARSKWLNDWEAGFADPQHLGVALSESVAQGDWRLFFLTRDRIRALKLEDVQRVATSYLVASNRTVGEYVPTPQPQRAPAPHRVDVAAQLQDFHPVAQAKPVQAFDASPHNIDASTQREAIREGLQTALLAKPTRGEAVKADLVLHFGNLKSLADWGVSDDAMASLLEKGSLQLNRQQVQDRLDALQAEWAFSVSPGVLHVSLSTKRDHLPALIDLLADVLQHPAFKAEDFQELQAQALSSIEAERKEPQAVLQEAVERQVDPYDAHDVRHARSFDEQQALWSQLALDKVKAFHATFIDASHAEFSAVGDFDPKAVREAVARNFASWHGKTAFERIALPLYEAKPVHLVLRTPDKQNAALQAVLALPLSDRDADYPALMLANHLLGGGGNSRLWNRIREHDGLSYGVSSSVAWSNQDENSQWEVSAIFAPQNREKVEQALQEEIARALKDGFTQAELETGKQSLLNYRQLSRAQDGRLAAAWVSNLYLGRDFSVSAKVDAQLQALTLEQVNAALRRYIHPDQLVIGVAGDFAH